MSFGHPSFHHVDFILQASPVIPPVRVGFAIKVVLCVTVSYNRTTGGVVVPCAVFVFSCASNARHSCARLFSCTRSSAPSWTQHLLVAQPFPLGNIYIRGALQQQLLNATRIAQY